MTSLEEVSASRCGALAGLSFKIYKIYIENVQHGRVARLFAIQLLKCIKFEYIPIQFALSWILGDPTDPIRSSATYR